MIGKLYQLFGQRILKIILKRNGGDLQAAEEVLSDTFTAAIKSFHTFQSKSSYFTWLTRIALNKMADYYRHEIHQHSRIIVPSVDYFNSLIDPKISLEEQVSLNDLKQKLAQSLNLIPPEYQDILTLKYFRDLSTKEICVKLDLTNRQLEGRLYRAKKSLAKVLSKGGEL